MYSAKEAAKELRVGVESIKRMAAAGQIPGAVNIGKRRHVFWKFNEADLRRFKRDGSITTQPAAQPAAQPSRGGMGSDGKRLLTTIDVAKQYNCTTVTVANWVRAGLLVAVSKNSKGYAFTQDAADAVRVALKRMPIKRPGSGNFGYAGRPGQVGGSAEQSSIVACLKAIEKKLDVLIGKWS